MLLYTFIQRLDDGLAAVERVLVTLIGAAIALVMMTQVVLRYGFSSPLFWAEEVSVQLLVFMTLFGLALLVRESQLVTIDFLPRALPARAREALFAVLGLTLLALLLFVAWLGWEWVSRPDVRIELGATTRLPRWYNYSVLPAALLAMSWHQFAAVLRHGRRALQGVQA